MIVITHLDEREFYVYRGDRFQLTISDTMNSTVCIDEEITGKRKINFMASFRFALEDGNCAGFHLAGIFANSKELPEEIKNAVLFKDLTKQQKENFLSSVGVSIND